MYEKVGFVSSSALTRPPSPFACTCWRCNWYFSQFFLVYQQWSFVNGILNSLSQYYWKLCIFSGVAISIVPNYVIDIASVHNQGLLGLMPQLMVFPFILCSRDIFAIKLCDLSSQWYSQSRWACPCWYPMSWVQLSTGGGSHWLGCLFRYYLRLSGRFLVFS